MIFFFKHNVHIRVVLFSPQKRYNIYEPLCASTSAWISKHHDVERWKKGGFIFAALEGGYVVRWQILGRELSHRKGGDLQKSGKVGLAASALGGKIVDRGTPRTPRKERKRLLAAAFSGGHPMALLCSKLFWENPGHIRETQKRRDARRWPPHILHTALSVCRSDLTYLLTNATLTAKWGQWPHFLTYWRHSPLCHWFLTQVDIWK